MNTDKDKEVGGVSDGQDNRFQVTISYNGINKVLDVNRNQDAQAVIARAMALFGDPAGDLGLYLGGTEILPGRSVEDWGITAGAMLLLRPRQVRGG